MSTSHVLVVDDDSDIRHIVQLALRFDGVTVETAENGAVALEKLRSSGLPFMILLDLMMPVMDGWALFKILSEDPMLCEIPVVVMTAFEDGPRPVPQSAGFMRKPVSLESIRKVVGKYSDHRRD